ncbi:MAG: PAS domain S-box protein [Phycisphaerae bacterium]|nr:PAS domain S-box protein [Phycisphaerae bacterium]
MPREKSIWRMPQTGQTGPTRAMPGIETGKQGKFRSLAATLAVAFFALSAGILLVAGSLQMYFDLQTQRKAVAGQQHILAQEAAVAVESFIQEKLAVLRAAVTLGDLARSRQEEQQLVLEKLLGLEPSFRQLALLNAQRQVLVGVSRLSSAASCRPVERVGSDVFLDVSRGETRITSIHVDELTSEPMIIAVVPVRDVFGDFGGVLIAEVNLKFMWDLVGRMRIGNKGQAYVVDRQGNLVASSDISRVLKGENLAQLKEVHRFVTGKTSASGSDADMSKGIQDTYVVATHVPLRTPDWAVVVELPVLEAYAGTVQVVRLSVLIALVSLVLAVATGLYLSKRITRPIVHLRDAAVEVGRGRLGTQIEIERNDETGELARAFNQMTRDLQGTTTSIDNLNKEIAERTRAEEEYRTILRTTIDGFWLTDMQGRFLDVNDAYCRLIGYSRDELLNMSIADVEAVERPEETAQRIRGIMATGGDRFETRHTGKNGGTVDVEVSVNYRQERGGQLFVFVRDITERKRAEAERERLHRELLDVSRNAGMVEVATNVLHNVGNVLNSVNVSATLTAERIRDSRASSLARVVALLKEHEGDLASFLTNDPKGRQLPAYLATLAEHMATEQADLLQEMESLTRNIEHIKEIVAVQQSYAKVSGIVETVAARDLVEDALRMNTAALERHEVRIVRQYADVPMLEIEKHKVLQILVNLIRNAKYALDGSPNGDKVLTLSIGRNGNGKVRITVSDNGVGIPPENLTRIFAHGFTTRKDGHGFGLHGGALTAKEIGGALTAQSEGPARGATFMLELPCGGRETRP